MLARLRRCNHRMATGVRMFAGVLIWRAVAAKRHATFLACAQMNPVTTDLHALFAFPAFRLFDGFDCVQMRTAAIGHYSGQFISRYEDVQSACRPFQSREPAFHRKRFPVGTASRMTPAEFKRKWARYSGKETSAYQQHFNDLCALLGQPTPATADPTGSQSFCFQKRVVKDAELFALEEAGRIAEQPETQRERGFADVWKRGAFAWEYKGKKKNLDAAYQQLLRYRESLLNPPLLIVCDFDRYVVRTNFNGTVQETYEFTNDQIDHPEFVRVLRAAFKEPEYLKPQR